MNTPAHYAVIDLEATCCDQRTISNSRMEIIEIGCVLADGVTLEPVAEFQTFVRPVLHPTLTAFCTKLTTITQAQVDGAPTFPEAIASLRAFLHGRDALFCSWGAYDKRQFELDAKRHRVELPFGDRHANLKAMFAENMGLPPKGTVGALRHVGLELIGTHHRGIDDARNITRLLPWSLGRAKAPHATHTHATWGTHRGE